MVSEMAKKNGPLSYLETYGSPKTISTYKWALRKFFSSVYRDKDLSLAKRYVTEERDREGDIEDFFISIKDSPPMSVALALSAVRVFFDENGILVSPRIWRKLKRRKKGSRAVTEDLVPTKEQLRQILTHMDAKGKAFFLMLASSGMRLGECLTLTLDEIYLTNDPVLIRINHNNTKSGNKRITFISSEGKLALKEWLKLRDQYILESRNKGVKMLKDRGIDVVKKGAEDNRVFPFKDGTARRMWNNSLKRAKLDDRDMTTDFHKLHIHTLRKFFRSQMATVIQVDIVEALMGHEGYLTEAYRKYSETQLADFYEQAEYTVTIFGVADIAGIRQKLDKAEDDLRKVSLIAIQNEDLRQKVSKIEKENDQLKTTVGDLAEQLGRFSSFIEMLGYDWDPTTGEVGYDRDKDQRRA